MWRKKKVIIIAVVAVVVLVVGSIGGIALAQTPTPTPGTAKTTILARVAAILGIDQKKVEDAFAQAQKEQRQEQIDNYLKNLVAQGKITQQQADQYKQWLQSKPDVPISPGIGPRHGMMGGWGMMPGWGGFRGGITPGATPSPSVTPQ